MKYGMAKKCLFQVIITQHVELAEMGFVLPPKALDARV
jgi:hypothetical protein